MLKVLYKIWRFTPEFIQNIIKYSYYKLRFSKNKNNLKLSHFKHINLEGLLKGKINLKLGKDVKIPNNNDIFGNIEIGDYTYTGNHCSIKSSEWENIKIGKFCSISWRVNILSTNHGCHLKEKLTTFPIGTKYMPGKTGSIIIGNDVWIGAGATILGGRKIGTGAIIGAGTIVTKDVPPYAIVVGNPGVIKSYRFDKETIRKLLESKRWDWPIEKIKENFNLEFLSKQS